MRLNVARKADPIFTHEGGKAVRINAEQQLRRSVMACFLWEDQFYEDGQAITDRIAEAAKAVSVDTLAAIAVEARKVHNLRHVPLLLASILALRAKGDPVVSKTIEQIIGRADELAEFLSVFAKVNGVGVDNLKKVLTHGVRKGLRHAFKKFDAYQIAKWNRDGAVKLRDVLFLTHPKADNNDQQIVWNKLVTGDLESPDTWEVSLSAGSDKKETFERLLLGNKLGYLAVLRNLRGMMEAGVDRDLVSSTILARRGAHRVLPFRYVAAARACPQLEPVLDKALGAAVNEAEPFSGLTYVLVDVSASMDYPLSAKSDLKRIDAAAALASVIPGQRRVFSFSYNLVEVAPRYGMAGVDAIIKSQPHGGTNLAGAVTELNRIMRPEDRLIVVTDEQTSDRVPEPVAKRAYLINVASYQNGVGYGRWTHIDGFSEGVLKYIQELEADQATIGV
jgi:60 kDa SS-A/Ro ribonucleoprotein